MNSSDTPAKAFCMNCGRPSPAGALTCDACGRDFSKDGTIHDTDPSAALPPSSSPSIDAGPVVLSAAASAETLSRLRTLLDELAARGFARFPGELLWPDGGGGELLQAVPRSMTSLARLLEEPPQRHGWQLSLITDLAQAVDDLHRSGGLFRGLRPEAVLLDRDTLALAGFCVPLCMSRLGEVAEEAAPEGLEPPFASPEALGEVDAEVGPQADIYLVAVLASALLTGARPNDPVLAGPAVTAVLEDAVAESPALRPATASEFVRQLRRALVRDTATSGWDFQSSGLTDIGLGGRTNNEDAWGGWVRADAGLGAAGSLAIFLVADGMGGEAHGERASSRAVAAVLEEAEDYLPHLAGALSHPPALATAGHDWVLRLNEEVLALGRRLGSEGRMGTTLSGLLFVGRRALLFHAGDSRVYVLRDGVLAQLTRDQTFAQELRDQGLLSSEAETAGMYKNVLVSHLGSTQCRPQVETLVVHPGDRFLLCSDGLVEGLEEDVLIEVLATAPIPVAARTLIEESKRRLTERRKTAPGSDGRLKSDNMTAVVVEMLLPGGHDEEPTAAPPTLELSPPDSHPTDPRIGCVDPSPGRQGERTARRFSSEPIASPLAEWYCRR
jgi:protein phosphatase